MLVGYLSTKYERGADIEMFVGKRNRFGDRIKRIRLRCGWTQAELAAKLNIAASTMGMYEQGRREPDKETLADICRELNVSVDYILGVEGSLKTSGSDIDVFILDFIDFINSKDSLTFSGIPLNDDKKNRITYALKIAAAISAFSVLGYDGDFKDIVFREFISKLSRRSTTSD